MHVKILGAHQLETKDTRLTSFLIDGRLAIDAGSLTSTLTLEEQRAIKSILVTHHHYDHVRDLLTFGFNTESHTTGVYSIQHVLDSLSSNLVNGALYPDFTSNYRSQPPSLVFHRLTVGESTDVDGYQILPLSVPHGPPTVGYQIIDGDGGSLFYSGDTGPGCSSAWPHIRPNLLLIEVTLPNRLDEPAGQTGHLTSELLMKELQSFRNIKGYLPRVVAVHINPMYEKEIRYELDEVARLLDADLTPAHEGMEVTL